MKVLILLAAALLATACHPDKPEQSFSRDAVNNYSGVAQPHLTPAVYQTVKADEDETGDAEYYGAAAPFYNLAIHIEDPEGTRYGQLKMGDVFDSYGGLGYSCAFERLEGGSVVMLAIKPGHRVLLAYQQSRSGYYLHALMEDGEITSRSNEGPGANSPDARLIRVFQLRPVL